MPIGQGSPHITKQLQSRVVGFIWPFSVGNIVGLMTLSSSAPYQLIRTEQQNPLKSSTVPMTITVINLDFNNSEQCYYIGTDTFVEDQCEE